MEKTRLLDAIENKTAQVVVLGLGYVGLPVACLFAQAGFPVVGIRRSQDKVDMINRGECLIEGEEPDLADPLREVIAAGLLRAWPRAFVDAVGPRLPDPGRGVSRPARQDSKNHVRNGLTGMVNYETAVWGIPGTSCLLKKGCAVCAANRAFCGTAERGLCVWRQIRSRARLAWRQPTRVVTLPDNTRGV